MLTIKTQQTPSRMNKYCTMCHAAPGNLYKTLLHRIKFNLWTETRDEILASGANPGSKVA